MGLFSFFKKQKGHKFDIPNNDLPNTKNLYIHLINSVGIDKLNKSKEIHNKLIDINPMKLLKVDKSFREGFKYDWMYNWKKINPDDLIHKDLTIDEKISILGITSFHSNGYLRENAINSLSKIESPRVIPFLLFRINDWVSQVQKSAQDSLLKYYDIKYYSIFIECLPIILSFKEKSKNETSSAINKIINLLIGEEELKSLRSGLNSDNPTIRLACYKVILQYNLLHKQEVMEIIILDTNPHNRLYILKYLSKEIKNEEFIKISEPFLNDKFAKIRYLIMEMILSSRHEKYASILEKAVFDNNRSIRELGRYYSSLQNKYNLDKIYQDALQKSKYIYPSICGIGEIGKKEDIVYIVEYLDSDIIKFVKATLSSIAKLDYESYKDKIIMFISDQRRGVSKTAYKLLTKIIYDNDAETIYKIYNETKYSHVKINCCSLLISLSKWTALTYILEFYTNENKIISKMCKVALDKWIIQFNRSFINPTKDQKETILKYLNKYGKLIDVDLNFIYFSINNFL